MRRMQPGCRVGTKADTTYLVECYWLGVTREAVEAANGRARERAALLRQA